MRDDDRPPRKAHEQAPAGPVPADASKVVPSPRGGEVSGEIEGAGAQAFRVRWAVRWRLD